jgi:hypothetical protein
MWVFLSSIKNCEAPHKTCFNIIKNYAKASQIRPSKKRRANRIAGLDALMLQNAKSQ